MSEWEVDQLVERNAKLLETLRMARGMLLELRDEVAHIEARDRLILSAKQRRWRLQALRAPQW